MTPESLDDIPVAALAEMVKSAIENQLAADRARDRCVELRQELAVVKAERDALIDLWIYPPETFESEDDLDDDSMPQLFGVIDFGQEFRLKTVGDWDEAAAVIRKAAGLDKGEPDPC